MRANEGKWDGASRGDEMGVGVSGRIDPAQSAGAFEFV